MDDKFLKPYSPQETEPRIYKLWEKSGFFNPDNLPKRHKDPYTIIMPPPNVTGVLHMGHALTITLEDIMIRYQRMQGKKTLWLPGTDHAAIATQSKVEKDIRKSEDKSRYDLGREELLKRIDIFAKQSHDTIVSQTKVMGASCDWSREAFTLDEKRNLAVRTVFKKMYDDGLIYRGNRIVNWDPKGQTTISDDEIVYEERDAKMYTFKYSKDFPLSISTTRPETKLGDVAVAVHPDDSRYKKYIGKEYDAVFCGAEIHIKIIADKEVEKDFGTGALGVTPAHSKIDWEIAERHNLPKDKIVIDEKAKMIVGNEQILGKKVTEAREIVVEWLKSEGLLEKEEVVKQNVSTAERTGGIVEPMPKLQWFVAVNKPFKIAHSEIKGIKSGDTTTLKDIMRNAVMDGQTSPVRDREGSQREFISNGINIIPDYFDKTYFHWIEKLSDWCISRQIWYGHRIPVWYKKLNKKMGFYEKVIPQIYQGKTKTYRLKDREVKIGDEIAFENTQTSEIFGQGKITNAEKTTVGQIDLQDKSHGSTYNNVQELINAFKKHYPDKEINGKTPVFIYEYEFSQGNDANIYCDINEPKGSGWIQDEDTLDTWFSSAMWTFSTLGWPEKTSDLKLYHPTNVLETGYDILFFWVARMILMTGYTLGTVPFHTVYLHGMVRDTKGKKMSKSLGNNIDPVDMAQKFGADAERISLTIANTPGTDFKISEDKIKGYKNFANKIWNITRFILENTKGTEYSEKFNKFTEADLKLIEERDIFVADMTKDMEEYRFYMASEKTYHYVWHTLADIILEDSKKVFSSGADSDKESRKQFLLHTLRVILKILHPFMPFLTEEIWQSISGDKSLLMIEEWPVK